MKKKKLFSKYINVNSVDCSNDRIFNDKSEDDKKTKFVFNDEYKIVKNNLISDFEIHYLDKKIATIKSKPVSDIDYAIMIYDDKKDMESVLTIISKIIY